MKKNIDVQLVAILFCVLAISMRLVPHAYNVAAIGALAMFVGYYWSARIGFLMAIAAMAVSDLLGHWMQIPSLGLYQPWLMAIVYFAIAMAALVGRALGGSKPSLPLWVGVPLGAVASTVVFFFISNFGSWLDPQMGYPQSVGGLVECYVAALPFAKNSLLGNFLYSGIFFGSFNLLVSLPRFSRVGSK